MRKTALKFTKVYSYISITMAHHMKLNFFTVVVHINTDILVEFHFDSCESSFEAASVNCRLNVVFLITYALRNDAHFTVAI